VSFSTFWHAKGGVQMCVFRSRYEIFFGPSLGGDRPLAPRGSATDCVTVKCSVARSNCSRNRRL